MLPPRWNLSDPDPKNTERVEAFHSYCALQSDLGLVWHRQAELEEFARIQEVRPAAVESGLVVTPTNNMEECPFCLETFCPLPSFMCCGGSLCGKCVTEHKKKARIFQQALIQAVHDRDKSEYGTRKEERKILHHCPLCRTELLCSEEDAYQMAMINAKAGKA
jgi:hypothetical protein